MTDSPRLGFTYIEQSQAQKEVTVNAALARIDAVLNSGARDKDLATPPGSPSEGDVYIVASSATGDWAGQENAIAYYDQLWRFITPNEGMRLWVNDEDREYIFDGSGWRLSGVGNGVLKPITAASRVVITGDSIVGVGATTSSGTSVYFHQRAMLAWLQVLSGFAFVHEIGNDGSSNVLGDNSGVGGYDTTDILGIFDSEVLSRSPDIVIVHAGTNDVEDDVSAATITANLQAMAEKTLRANAVIALVTILPRSAYNNTQHGLTSNDWTADQRKTYHAVNQWIHDYCLRTPNAIVIDPNPYFVDPTTSNGDIRDALSHDGLHPTPVGGYYMGLAAIDALGHLFASTPNLFFSPSDIYDATYNIHGNIMTNGALSGTSGSTGTGGSGTVADGFKLERNGGSDATATGSKISRPDGLPGEMQQIICTTTGGGSGIGSIRFGNTSPSNITNGLVTGEWYEAMCEIEVDSSSGGNGLYGLYLELRDAGSGGSKTRCFNLAYEYDDPASSVYYPLPDVAWKGVFKTPPLQITSTHGLRFYLFAEMDESLTDSVTIRVGRVSIRRCVSAPSF